MVKKVAVELAAPHFLFGRRYEVGDKIRIPEDLLNPSMRRLDGKGDFVPESDLPPTVSTQREVLGRIASESPVESLDEAQAASAEADAIPDVSPPAKEEVANADRQRKLLVALTKLDHDSDKDWYSSGLPKVTSVERIAGFNTSREELEEIAPHIRRRK